MPPSTSLTLPSSPSPLSRLGSAPVPEPSTPEEGGLLGKRVVLVEDEGLVQLQMRRLFTQYGAIVVGIARSGPEAVEVVLETRPDLVLMDIVMPGEYDGLEAARRILESYSVCMIVLTGLMEDTVRESAEQIGVCGYLVKPAGLREIMPTLEVAMQDYSRSQCG